MSVIKTGTTSTTGYIVESDTNGNLVIQTGSTPTTALTLNSNQTATFAQSVNIPNTFGFKNRIINGGMVIDQRNAGASFSPTTTSGYTLDRWVVRLTQNSKLTVQQNAGSVTPPAGFTNYLGVTSSSTYSVLSTDVFTLAQAIEGFNTADLGFGTANAASVTLSFWVRSSLTGSFGGALINSATNRSYPFSYTISAANTWEQKTVTIAGDTSGTWLTNSSTGIEVRFGLGSGSNYTGTANVWGTANAAQPPSTVSVVGTNGATFYITGVQLERGSTATSFDFRPYGTELMLCQRYFLKWTGGAGGNDFPAIGSGLVASSTQAYVLIPTPATLRATPVISFTGSVLILDGTASPALTSVNTIYTPGANSFWVTVTGSAGGLTGGRGAMFYCVNATTNSFSVSAEL